MKLLSSSDHWLLFIFLSLLWGITDSISTPATSTSTESPTTSTTLSTTKPPPPNVDKVNPVGQNETSITLQWNKVDEIQDYRLLFNGNETNVSAEPDQNNVTHTVVELSSGTKYDFTLFTVDGNVSSSGVNSTAVTAPPNAKEFKSSGQNETSITLQWNKVRDDLNYTIVFNERKINVSALAETLLTQVISNLTTMTEYNFTLFTVFEYAWSTGVSYSTFTAPPNVGEVKPVKQNETSITLQWNKVNDIQDYRLLFNGKETNVSAEPDQNNVTHTVEELSSGTKYDFTLFSVFGNVSSSGVNSTAVTAPPNAKEFKSSGQNETSITLQWNNVRDDLNYTIVFNEMEINVSASAKTLLTQVISNLTTMTEYNFTLFTVFEYAWSTGVSYSTFTAPPNVGEVKPVKQNETSITLQWNKVNDIQDYRLLFNGKETNVSAEPDQNNVTHTVEELSSGTKYDFTLFSVFGNVSSSGVNFTAVTAPLNAKEFKSSGQNETSITLQWNNVNDVQDYRLLLNGKETNVPAEPDQNKVTHTIGNLSSGTKYEFTLFSVFQNVLSSGVNFTAVTVPLKVPLVNVTKRSVTSLTLTWNIDMTKGWNYSLQINGEYFTFVPETGIVSQSVPSLKPGTEYRFNVTTVFFGVNSSAYTDSTVTTIDCASAPWHVTNSSIQGRIEGLFTNATATYNSQNHISPEGGNVLFTGLYPGATYQVSLVYKHLVQCKHSLTILPPDLSAHCKPWAAGYSIYVAWNKPEGVWTQVEVNVTGKTKTVGEEEEHLIMSGFQPAKKYEVSISSLSGSRRNSKPFVFLCYTDPRGVIAGSVMAVLLFGILACLVVFIFHKRPDILSSRKKSSVGGSKKDFRPISATKFPEHFDQLSCDNNWGFSQEYESLIPVGTEQTRKDALLPENREKNRFSNVLPYDWCRVKLTTSSPNAASNYINASYMPGYYDNRAYIATQGPLPSTVNDFWRMIWEQTVKGIVMVTNCNEGGRVKCQKYWPADSQPCTNGELLVSMTSEQQEPYWTLREFTVKHIHTSEKRRVKHFHFTAWPDHGVPQGTELLIQFRGLVRQHIQREGAAGPTVVHCSAGVGRTGTIIALDVLLQQLEKENEVGINGFVHKMRLSRPHMVQTESQYVFLHQCIMDHLPRGEKTAENLYENSDIIYENATALQEFHAKDK